MTGYILPILLLFQAWMVTPAFGVSLQPIYRALDDTVSLRCSFGTKLRTLHAVTTIVWQKSPDVIYWYNFNGSASSHAANAYKNRVKITNNLTGGYQDLFLYNSTLSDEGQYSCEVFGQSKVFGKASSTLSLKVLGKTPPEIRNEGKKLLATDCDGFKHTIPLDGIKSESKFTCIAPTTKPASSINWIVEFYKDYEIIKSMNISEFIPDKHIERHLSSDAMSNKIILDSLPVNKSFTIILKCVVVAPSARSNMWITRDICIVLNHTETAPMAGGSNMNLTGQNKGNSSSAVPIAVAVSLFVVVLALAIGLSIWCKRQKCHNDKKHPLRVESETTDMDTTLPSGKDRHVSNGPESQLLLGDQVNEMPNNYDKEKGMPDQPDTSQPASSESPKNEGHQYPPSQETQEQNNTEGPTSSWRPPFLTQASNFSQYSHYSDDTPLTSLASTKEEPEPT